MFRNAGYSQKCIKVSITRLSLSERPDYFGGNMQKEDRSNKRQREYENDIWVSNMGTKSAWLNVTFIATWHVHSQPWWVVSVKFQHCPRRAASSCCTRWIRFYLRVCSPPPLTSFSQKCVQTTNRQWDIPNLRTWRSCNGTDLGANSVGWAFWIRLSD